MRKLILRVIGPFLQVFAKYYFSKPRSYSFKSIKGVVLPGVFYPQLTISTKLLLEFIEPLNLEGKSFLELGCGTGFISVLAAKKGGKVLALDINPKAIENTNLNAFKNEVELTCIPSDLFAEVSNQIFDYILINPPYYPRDPKNVEEKAWFCGENFDYFNKLFTQLPRFFNSQSKVFMILSEDCELAKIKEIAYQHQISFQLVTERKKWGEDNFIFQLKGV